MGRFATMKGKVSVIDRLRRIPDAVRQAVGDQLLTEVNDLVEAQKRAAPVGGEDDPNPGKFRDSIHSYPTPGRPLSYRVIADAKDPKGRNIGRNIEFGHHALDGTYVPARPSFFPTYRARKKGMRSRLAAAGRKAFKAASPSFAAKY